MPRAEGTIHIFDGYREFILRIDDGVADSGIAFSYRFLAVGGFPGPG